MYLVLSELELDVVESAKNVWNPLIPQKVSVLIGRLLQNRLPTKDNLCLKGIRDNASTSCVCGCGSAEKINHLFFNCPVLAVVLNETLKWRGIQTAIFYGGFDDLKQLKGLVLSTKKVKDILGLICCANISIIWKANNAMIFDQDGFNWEKVVKEAKIFSSSYSIKV